MLETVRHGLHAVATCVLWGLPLPVLVYGSVVVLASLAFVCWLCASLFCRKP